MKTFKTFISSLMTEKIIERDGKYVVTTKDGSKELGVHNTKKSALKQLQAIEISKVKQ